MDRPPASYLPDGLICQPLGFLAARCHAPCGTRCQQLLDDLFPVSLYVDIQAAFRIKRTGCEGFVDAIIGVFLGHGLAPGLGRLLKAVA